MLLENGRIQCLSEYDKFKEFIDNHGNFRMRNFWDWFTITHMELIGWDMFEEINWYVW